MSVVSSRTLQIQFSGDISTQIIQSALDNDLALDVNVLQSLVLGANTISAPVVAGKLVTGLTIIPPAGNGNLITLKGVSGDTGFPLHLTDPTSIALDSTFVSLVLSVSAPIVGVRFIWT